MSQKSAINPNGMLSWIVLIYLPKPGHSLKEERVKHSMQAVEHELQNVSGFSELEQRDFRKSVVDFLFPTRKHFDSDNETVLVFNGKGNESRSIESAYLDMSRLGKDEAFPEGFSEDMNKKRRAVRSMCACFRYIAFLLLLHCSFALGLRGA